MPPRAAPQASRPSRPPAKTPSAKKRHGPEAARRPPPWPALPPKVGKALVKARRTVVLFFRQPAADDDATAAAVRSLRGLKGVVRLHAPHRATSRATARVVAGLGISQAPAVVIVGKEPQARLIEGFVDAGTLSQQVSDAR